MTVPADRYLALLKTALAGELYVEAEALVYYLLHSAVNGGAIDIATVNRIAGRPDLVAQVRAARREGRAMSLAAGQPPQPVHALRGAVEIAHTMVGRLRLDNLHACLDIVRRENVPGDLIETGVWRGGACIFMRGYLLAHAMADRAVWVADSFDGLPPPTHPRDAGVDLSKAAMPFLAVPRAEVEALFARYDLLDGQVRFLEGWFRDTLPAAPIERLALLRLDGDLYESTMDALTALYHKVSPGGFVIVDDYHTNATCSAAIHDFRRERGIDAALQPVDRDAVFWRVERAGA